MTEIPAEFHIHATEHWLVNHRINSALPGYMMVSSKVVTNDLSELSAGALSALGLLLAEVQNALQLRLKANRVYIGRYGHTARHVIAKQGRLPLLIGPNQAVSGYAPTLAALHPRKAF